MKKCIFFIVTLISIKMSVSQLQLALYEPYKGKDLGVTYTAEKTTFKIWSPQMDGFTLRLYTQGDRGLPYKTIQFKMNLNGVFEAIVMGNLLNKFYTYQGYKQNGLTKKWNNEVPDIYAKAVGVNGKRGMIVDLATTNPMGWAKDRNPFKGGLNDAIIYELHVRDATKKTTAKNAGKFLGLTEKGLVNKYGQSVGLDHIKQLGVTHVQLLPVYDYFTVDEKIKDNKQYNWGYDPLNYNVPEGSYSTNPYDGNVRIKEFKQLIKTFHDNGIAVIMDMVYNHTMFGEESYLNQLAPQYYYRQDSKGGFSNASACGNETASDRPMMRKFILESVLHWVNEYHIDGFRFDLMAIHDITTMNLIADEVRKIKPNAIILGEGWTAGASPLPDEEKALKRNAYKMNNIAVFSDDIRDAIKGNVFDHKDNGFASNKLGVEESIKFGLVGAINHPGLDYSKVNYCKEAYTTQPYQMIAYNECHDNHTLWDRFKNSVPGDDDKQLIERYKFATAIVLLGQGVPFLHAGQEMCRTKFGEENSFKSSDSINAIDWDRLKEFDEVHQLTKQLINIRKAYPQLRFGNADKVKQNVTFKTTTPGIIHMVVNNDKAEAIHVIFNGTKANYKTTANMNYKLLASSKNDKVKQTLNNSFGDTFYNVEIGFGFAVIKNN